MLISSELSTLYGLSSISTEQSIENTNTEHYHLCCHGQTGLLTDNRLEGAHGAIWACVRSLSRRLRDEGWGGGAQRSRSSGACVGSRSSRAPPSRRGQPSSAFGIDRQESRIASNKGILTTTQFYGLQFTSTVELCRSYYFGKLGRFWSLDQGNSMQIFGDIESPSEAIKWADCSRNCVSLASLCIVPTCLCSVSFVIYMFLLRD